MLKVNHFSKTIMLMVATCLVITANASVSNNPPTVVITNPSIGQTYTGIAHVMIAADAADTDGSIVSVEFMVDGVTIGMDTSYPYYAGTALQPGVHTITVKATDDNGNESYSSTQVSVLMRPTTGLGTKVIGAIPQALIP